MLKSQNYKQLRLTCAFRINNIPFDKETCDTDLWLKTKLKTFLSKTKVEKYWNNVQPKIEHVFPKEIQKE